MGLSISVEWLDAPGVEDVVDAALWGRLEISGKDVDGAEAVVLTGALDSATGQIRSGIYGSLYPLARWVADSYWSLLWETPRTPRLRSGRDSARIDWLRPWVQRHCLLTAREGFSLPDLSIARDGDHLVIAAFADSTAPGAPRRPVSFLTTATLRVAPQAFDASLRTFMDAVLERLRGVDHPDVRRLRADWSATMASDPDEARLCSWAARLGLDPYDPDELDARTVELIQDHLGALPIGLRTDLLDAVIGGPELADALTWLDGHTGALRGLPEPTRTEPLQPTRAAHETGYLRARGVRRELGLGTGEGSVVGAVAARFGFDLSRESSPSSPPPPPLESLVGAVDPRSPGQVGSPPGGPILVGEPLAYEPRTFRWARGLYLWRFGHLVDGPRLLTRSHERVQREGRAFAAELLAPAAALRRHIRRGLVDEQQVADLASRFNVSPMLIRHQIENHALAILE